MFRFLEALTQCEHVAFAHVSVATCSTNRDPSYPPPPKTSRFFPSIPSEGASRPGTVELAGTGSEGRLFQPPAGENDSASLFGTPVAIFVVPPAKNAFVDEDV